MEYCRSATNGGTRRHDRGDQRHKLYSPEECTYTCVVKTCSSCVTPHWLMTLLHIRCTHTSHQGAKQERIFAMMSMFVFCQVWEKNRKKSPGEATTEDLTLAWQVRALLQICWPETVTAKTQLQDVRHSYRILPGKSLLLLRAH